MDQMDPVYWVFILRLMVRVKVQQQRLYFIVPEEKTKQKKSFIASLI